MSVTTSPTLLQLAGGGDSEAWRRIVEVYTPLVYRWASRCGVPQSDVPDVCQEAWTAVFRTLPEFERQRVGSFRNWLRTIVRNKIKDAWRKQGDTPGTLPDNLP